MLKGKSRWFKTFLVVVALTVYYVAASEGGTLKPPSPPSESPHGVRMLSNQFITSTAECESCLTSNGTVC